VNIGALSGRRGRVLFALAAVAAGLGWIASRGLQGNLVYYKTPTEILHQGSSAVGQRFRLGGLVMPGTVQPAGQRLRFVVSDGTTSMTVIDTGGVPSLFRAGAGVVLEGVYGSDGAFHADTVLVKHSDSYTPPAPGETPHSAPVG
jgi:cytochrome c-type biogenesis protein CcmE